MPSPSALSTERPSLHLVRDGDTLSALVNDRSPQRRAIPVLRGTIDEFEDFALEGSTLIRHTTPRGVPTLRNIPTKLLTLAVRKAFYLLFAAIELAELTQIGPVA